MDNRMGQFTDAERNVLEGAIDTHLDALAECILDPNASSEEKDKVLEERAVTDKLREELRTYSKLEESRIVLAALRIYSDLSVESCTDMALSDKERAWYLAEVEKADHLIELYQRERSMLGG